MQLILASASPRREELLRQGGFRFDVRPALLSEVRAPGERAEAFVERLARDKALQVAASSPPGALVLGFDTAVVVDGALLGKPADAAEAAAMLRTLSARAHLVMTGVCLIEAPARIEALRHETTRVHFKPLSHAEILDYVATSEPYDKAGAYAIQGRASRFIERVEGSYSNVVGLPIHLASELLRRCGVFPRGSWNVSL